MNILPELSLEEIEYNIKKKGLWDVVITDNVSYRDIFNFIKDLHLRNIKLKSDLDKLNQEISYKDELLKNVYEIKNSNFFINVIQKGEDN